jgi:hypothetical protein
MEVNQYYYLYRNPLVSGINKFHRTFQLVINAPSIVALVQLYLL